MQTETKIGEPAKKSLDKFNLALRMMAGAFILFMLVSLFYLYVAVGSSWGLVAKALFDSRILGALWISVSSAFIVGAIAIVVAIPTAYVLTYNNFRGKTLMETLLIEFPQTFPPATVGLVYLLMLGPGSPIDIAYTYPAVIIAKLYVSAPFALSFTLRRFREIHRTGLDVIAESLGGRTRHVLFWVLIPLSAIDLLGGFSLTWARAMGELAATLIFAGAIQWKTEIFPVVVLTTSQSDPPLALAASLIAAVLSIVALMIFKWIVGRRR
ncbi:MAG: molybdate transport system permease protein [Thermoproteota archaeon]|nr:molybdate transport system permease protein [Thermoproteota archaeon]